MTYTFMQLRTWPTETVTIANLIHVFCKDFQTESKLLITFNLYTYASKIHSRIIFKSLNLKGSQELKNAYILAHHL